MEQISAVEWLENEIGVNNMGDFLKDKIKQAKQMEKGQIMKTWYDCKLSIIERNPTDAEQYYNETFKSE
jgi:hypothetical protein